MQYLKNEEKFYNQQGSEILKSKESLIVNSPYSFLAGSSIAFDYAMKLIGDIEGKKVLDYGCGSGWLSTYLAKMRTMVYGFDISSKLIEVGIKRAEINGVTERIKLKRMIAEKLNYPDNFFDVVIGISILHHIDLVRGGKELHRVMKGGGKAIFIEPLGENIFLNFIRDFIGRKILKKRTEYEHPLHYKDLEKLKPYFNYIKFNEFQLFGVLERYIGYKMANFLKLDKIDILLLNKFPYFKKFCRLIVIQLIK